MQGKSGEDLSASEVLLLRTVKSAKRDVNLALSIRSIFLWRPESNLMVRDVMSYFYLNFTATCLRL